MEVLFFGKMKIGDLIFITIMIMCLFSLGFVSNTLYKDYKNERILDGLNLRNFNESYMEKTTQELDSLGDWVCINIKGMEFDKAVEICQHEVGYEIFAEICEKDMNKCFAVVEELE